MGIVTILAAIVAAAAVAVAGVMAARSRSTQRDLVAARTENEKLTVRLASVDADQRTADGIRQELAEVRSTLTAERDDALTALAEAQKQRTDLEKTLTEARARRTELDAELLDEHRRRTELEAELAGAREQLAEATTGEDQPAVPEEADDSGTDPAPSEREPDGCWALLLADVERRWAAVVGAPPDLRGVHLGAVGPQMEEALSRETDRLREEVGVDISLVTGRALEPDDPVLFLLATTDLLGALATNCQKVLIEADTSLTLTGEEWSGPTTDLEAARDRVQAAGAAVEELVIDPTGTPENGPGGDGSDAARLARSARYQVKVAVHPG